MAYWFEDWRGKIPPMTCFEDVERIYNTTKPVISVHHTKEHDIRPYGKRTHKSRRIVKVSRDCYVVMTHGETLPNAWHFEVYTGKYLPTDPKERRRWVEMAEDKRRAALAVPKSDYEKYGCVVWRRHRDGTQTLTLRNTPFGSQTGHLMSLEEVLPSFAALGRRRFGCHTIRHKGEAYLLPLSTKVSPWWGKVYSYRAGKFSNREDGRYIRFRRDTEGQWNVEHDCNHMEDQFKKLVDTEAKAPYRKAMAKFRDWCVVTYAMIGRNGVWDWGRDRDNYEEKAQLNLAGPETWREIVMDEAHPQRWAAAMVLLYDDDTISDTPYSWSAEPETDFKVRQRNNLNRALNRRLGFVKENN